MAGGGRLKRKPLVCRVEKICGINGMAADLARRGKGKEITGGVLHWIPLLSKRGLWSWCEVARTVLCRRGAIGNAGSTLQAVRTANSAAEADATRNQATPWPPLRKYRQNDISLPYQVLMMTRRFWLAGVDIWKTASRMCPEGSVRYCFKRRRRQPWVERTRAIPNWQTSDKRWERPSQPWRCRWFRAGRQSWPRCRGRSRFRPPQGWCQRRRG